MQGFKEAIIAMVIMFVTALWFSKAEADEWTVLEASAYAITIADYLQTRQIRKRDDLEESNTLFCGKQPSEACVAAWMLARGGFVYWMNNKSKYRNFKIFGVKVKTMYTGLYVVNTGLAVDNNLRFGLKVKM